MQGMVLIADPLICLYAGKLLIYSCHFRTNLPSTKMLSLMLTHCTKALESSPRYNSTLLTFFLGHHFSLVSVFNDT